MGGGAIGHGAELMINTVLQLCHACNTIHSWFHLCDE